MTTSLPREQAAAQPLYALIEPNREPNLMPLREYVEKIKSLACRPGSEQVANEECEKVVKEYIDASTAAHAGENDRRERVISDVQDFRDAIRRDAPRNTGQAERVFDHVDRIIKGWLP